MTLTKRSKTWTVSDDADASDITISQSDAAAVSSQLNELKDIKKQREQQRSWFVSRRFIFPLGLLLGVILGFALIQPSDIQDMHSQLSLLMENYDIALPQFPEFDFTRLETEWAKFRINIPELWKFNRDGREFSVGLEMKERGLSAEYPVVLIPGVISTSLESWSTTPEFRPFFREKLWGGLNMLSQVTFNRERWITAMMLDPITGLDPPDTKVRAAEGIDAASSFLQGYWIWTKIVENLAVVNYDTNNLYLAPYDWRLSYYNLEERDGYFSKLKMTIEGFKGKRGRQSSQPTPWDPRYFCFKWVESPQHGRGGPTWVEDHVEAYISIAGTHLGVAKAMAAFLSGEMKDTVQMNPAGTYVLERFFSRAERRRLFLTWAGSAGMWLKGGNAIWGNTTQAPDDDHGADHTHGELIAFRHAQQAASLHSGDPTANMTSDDAGTWILQHTPSSFQRMLGTNYSFGFERDEQQLQKNDLDHRKWSNPLEVRLPNAPSMKMYCVYGHGKETERSYWYARGSYEHDEASGDKATAACEDPSVPGCSNLNTPLNMPLQRESWIDAEYTNEETYPKVRNGVRMGEGDGTVSLLSLGAMCVEGWKRKRWNPAGIKVKTIELPHRPNPTIPRGGANTSDHVDILGSTGLNEIILKVATGAGDEIEDNFVSNIREYSTRIQWD